jgi:hypothetical protein
MLALHRIGNPRCDQAACVRLRAAQGMLFRVRPRGPAGRSSLEGYANFHAVSDVARARIEHVDQSERRDDDYYSERSFLVHAP